MKVLGFATYPIARPRQGGQLRVSAIARTYREAGLEHRHIGVYNAANYAGPFVAAWDVPFAPDHSPILGGWVLNDLRAGLFAAEDAATFARIRATFTEFAPDAFQLEQPWCWPVVKRLLAETGSIVPRIIYSAHNIEAPMKRDALRAYGLPGEEEVHRSVLALETELAGAADIVLAVTEADAAALLAMGAKAVHVLPNGIDAKAASAAALESRRASLGADPFALFVGSAHPPNALGFMAMLGPALAFLPPDRSVVVVGGVQDILPNDEGFRLWDGINRSRTRFAGIVDAGDLAAIIALAQVIILPITEGGGSNIKTAEALYSGCYVVGTSLAFRGFERFIGLPGVFREDEPAEFKRRLAALLEAPPPPPASEADNALRRELLWSSTLASLPGLARSLTGNATTERRAWSPSYPSP